MILLGKENNTPTNGAVTRIQMSASVPRCSRRAHFSSRHGEWDTPSRIWSHPTTASPTLRKARLELEAAEELAALELRDIEIQKELIRQRLQVNLQKLEAAAACRLLFRPESYANQQDHLRTTTGFFFEATSAEPPVQPAEQARCTVDPEVLMDVDHMATVAILDKMATPETTARIDIVMASNPQTSTATSCFHSSAVCTRGETTTVIASSPSSSTSTFVSSVTDRDREINRHETATPCTGPIQKVNASQRLSFSMEVPGERPGDPGGTTNYRTTQAPYDLLCHLAAYWQVGILALLYFYVSSWKSSFSLSFHILRVSDFFSFVYSHTPV